jgi:hypothetical protein
MFKVNTGDWKLSGNVIEFYADDDLEKDIVNPPPTQLKVPLSNPEFYLFSTGVLCDIYHHIDYSSFILNRTR